MMLDADGALAFVRLHGVVLVSAKSRLPALVEAIAGAPFKGSWWGHPQGKHIFAVLRAVDEHPDVLTCRLAGGKLTLVHRRLWPALAAAAGQFDPAHLARVVQEHTASGRHVNRETPFPEWLPADAADAARALSPQQALALLGPTFVTNTGER